MVERSVEVPRDIGSIPIKLMDDLRLLIYFNRNRKESSNNY